jgi:hypothetical protein
MNGAVDRSHDFYDGSESVRHPAFRPVQVEPYRRTSTLDNLFPTGNGMAERDTQRVMMGIPRSPIGQSDDTFERSIWLRNDTRPSVSLYSKTYE